MSYLTRFITLAQACAGRDWENRLEIIDAAKHRHQDMKSIVLALSATIENLDHLYNWLKQIEQSRNRRIHKIQYGERYNFIKTFVYYDFMQLVPLNPISALDIATLNKKKIFPKDMQLLPGKLLNS
jgi:hypothetical protein